MPEDQVVPFLADVNTRLRDNEEKHHLLKDRVLLIGQNLIEHREQTLDSLQDIKKMLLSLKEEQLRMKEFLQRLAEHVSELARKEEVMIIQRQLDILK